MEWHWGNIGSFLAGLSTVVIAVAALRQGPAAVRAWIDVKRAQAEKEREEVETIRLERHRYLSGWSGSGVDTFAVAAVTEPDEVASACDKILSGDITCPYVILRLAEGGEGHDASRALDLLRLVQREGHLSRPPTIGEREAVERGLDAMGIPRASFGQVTPPPDQLA
jgi:hypothetical protein